MGAVVRVAAIANLLRGVSYNVSNDGKFKSTKDKKKFNLANCRLDCFHSFNDGDRLYDVITTKT